MRGQHSKPKQSAQNYAHNSDHNSGLRQLGFMLVFLSVASLSWDVYNMCLGLCGANFSGLADIWQEVDRISFDQLQNLVMSNLPPSMWQSVVLPALNTPFAVLFGLPGLWLIRSHSPEIQVRAPMKLEMQMISAGMNPRRMKR